MRPTWIRGRWMEQFSFLMAEQNQDTVQGPPLAQHKRQWAEGTVPFLLQQETNSYQIFETPKFWKHCPNLYKWKKEKKKTSCEIITKSKVPWRLPLSLGFSVCSLTRATRDSWILLPGKIKCLSRSVCLDAHQTVLALFSGVSAAVMFPLLLFSKNTHSVTRGSLDHWLPEPIII